MTRIYITGGPGGGKTTLARRFSSYLGYPCYEMDLIGWENGAGAERPIEVCLREVHEIAVLDNWMAEGGLHLWTEELLQCAEQIVWLDLSWSIARWRIVTRHLRASLAGTNKHRGLLKLYRFMHYAKEFYTSTQPNEGTRLAVAKKLQPYRQKLVHCRYPADVEAFFSRMIEQAR